MRNYYYEGQVFSYLQSLEAKGRILRFVRTEHQSDLDKLGIDFLVYLPGQTVPVYLQVKASQSSQVSNFKKRVKAGDVSPNVKLITFAKSASNSRIGAFIDRVLFYPEVDHALVNSVTTLLDEYVSLGLVIRYHYNAEGLWDVLVNSREHVFVPMPKEIRGIRTLFKKFFTMF